ncbi:hypothetical protein HHK36_001478 [Tetracentron sinense]|uniref:Uncharacterized protein n=1 Tax=Tetracentron sinense TaxID=13715 RepID=A0A835DRP2_TETSI|nr:hypothetical protein HHK36_001478 [Tetracentron sinense]
MVSVTSLVDQNGVGHKWGRTHTNVLVIDGDTRFAKRDEISTRDSDLPTPSHVVGIPAIGRGPSLCSQAAHIISDLTTILNPISDERSKPHEDMMVLKISQQDSIIDGNLEVPSDVPNTSSFTIFLYSLLSSSESRRRSNVEGQNGYHAEMDESASESVNKKKPVEGKYY